MHLLKTAAVLVLLLGGCAGRDHPSETTESGTFSSSTSSDDGTNTASPTSQGGGENVTRPLPMQNATVEMTNCYGGSVAATLPSAIAPGKPVSGWGAGDQTASDISMKLIHCDRVHWGPFERGPFSMVIDSHNQETPPETCVSVHPSSDGGRVLALYSFWFSDSDLAKWVNRTYGVPARSAIFDVARTTDNGVETTSWKWSTDSESSDLTLRAVQGNAPEDRFLERYAWHGNGTWYLFDEFQITTIPQADTGGVPGNLGASMLYRQAMPNPFAGRGDTYETMEPHIDIWRYKDAECKQPA